MKLEERVDNMAEISEIVNRLKSMAAKSNNVINESDFENVADEAEP